MSSIPSVLELIEKNNAKSNTGRKAEIAATVKQQELMKNAGELTPVVLLGPNGTRIPAYFSKAENAFLPQFEI